MRTRLHFSIVALVAGLAVASPARGQIYGLPRTGQTATYHPNQAYDLGDDGVVRAGHPRSGQRFSDLGNGTIFDAATGLIWQKADSSSQAYGGISGKASWADAFDYIAGLNQAKLGGHGDWRLPNAKELHAIVNMGTWLPAVFYIFSGMQQAPYWSGTTYHLYPENAYQIHFAEGFLQHDLKISVTGYVKGVRSYHTSVESLGFPKTGQTTAYCTGDDGYYQAGYPLSGPAFTDYSSTVRQHAVDLVWQKADSVTQSFGQYGGYLSWENAFAYIREMNREAYGGYADWRLPNLFELGALLDFGQKLPHKLINDLFNPYTQDAFYWSATTRFGSSADALAVMFGNGWTVQKYKLTQLCVRAVRGGPYSTPLPSPLFPTPTPDPATARGVPKTGQTVVYHSSEPPNDSGDDGVTQAGYPLTSTRWQQNTNGTVADQATGLIWQQSESSSKAFGGISGALTWEKAFQYVAAMNESAYAGYSDWRLPNLKEINSLVLFGGYPAISSLFTVKLGAGYWGSTTYADLPNGRRSYQISFDEGIMLWINMDESPAPTGYVRAVRGSYPAGGTTGFPLSGQTNIIHYPSQNDLGDDGALQAGYPADGRRFRDNGNGTVSDRATGLIWQKADSAFCPVGEWRGRLTWEEAFSYIKEMNKRRVSGYSTWRLPNYQELVSLVDFGQFYPALDPLLRSTVQPSLHWSSNTRHAFDNSYHWAINLIQGHGTFFRQTETAYVIGVLGGPGIDPGPTTTTPSPTPVGYHTPVPTPYRSPGTATPTPPDYIHPYYGLPKTGQTTLYHGPGDYDPGDDGAIRAGYPATTPRWENLGNGVLIDWGTGLMWQQSESHAQPAGGLSGVMTWPQAFNYVAAVNQSRFGGFSDWRIPNASELLTTHDLENNPLVNLNSYLFTDTVSDPYWTSNCLSDFSVGTQVFQVGADGQALPANLGSCPLGAVRVCRSLYQGIGLRGFPKTGQTITIHPASGWDTGDDGAIRSGYPSYGPRFTDLGNGVIEDQATGLAWESAGSETGMTWENAFDYIAELNRDRLGGRGDWRLPNVMELASIIDHGRFNPSIDPVFSGVRTSWYWSGSTVKTVTTNAWAVLFTNGCIDIIPKGPSSNYYVRAVRGEIIPGLRPTPTPAAIAAAGADYDGDGAVDIGVFRPSIGLWVIRGLTRFYFGARGDIPVGGDYDGNGACEAAIFRGRNGFWSVRGLTAFYFGGSGDLPIPGDYAGDGTTRAAIYRGSAGLWSVRALTRIFFGSLIDLPVPGDYSGDGTTDFALFRSLTGQWAVRNLTRFYAGGPGDLAVRLDADGDGTDEAGVFRSSCGLWAIPGFPRYYFGTSGDLPVPAEYSGEEPDERAVFRPGAGFWSISGLTRAYCGTSADLPLSR